LESDETAGWYKNGTNVFTNNKVLAYNPSLNFISKSPVITSAEVKEKALLNGNTEVGIELVTAQFPQWSTGWTRFPTKGN
jgi:hypothetical protein